MSLQAIKFKRRNTMEFSDVSALDSLIEADEVVLILNTGKLYVKGATGRKILNPYNPNTLTGTSENDIIMDGGTF